MMDKLWINCDEYLLIHSNRTTDFHCNQEYPNSCANLLKNIKDVSTYLRPKDKVWFTEWYKSPEQSLQYSMYKEIS